MRRPYGSSAEYYDAFYADVVDYQGDVEFLLKAFKKFGTAKPKTVLDLGAGTATHAILLAERGVKVEAVDVSEPLLEIAARKIKEERVEARVKLHTMDMTKKLPPGKFDAAICMFGAWCYLKTDEDCSKLLSMLAMRLPKGAPFVFEFWSPLGWDPQMRWSEADADGDRRVVRLTRPNLDLKDDVYEFEMEHIVMRDGKLVENFSEGHALRLRTPSQTKALLARNGFEVAAFTQGAREGKSFEKPSPREFRVMCVARRA